MKKNIIKCSIFITIFLLLCILISFILLPKENIKEFSILEVTGNEILGEKKDSIDVVFIGDSLTYSGISPMDIYKYKGYTSFDIGSPAQVIKQAYKHMEIAIESQHPKVIFFEANVIMRDPKKAKFKYKLSKFEELYIPIYTYHNNWKKMLFNFYDDSIDYEWINYTKGFKYVPSINSYKETNYMETKNKPKEIPSNNYDYVLKMKELCKKNNVKFIIISTPNAKSWDYSKYLAIRDLSTKLDIEYIDLNVDNPLNINWITETKDKGDHLNYQGALKVSKFIADYLDENDLVESKYNEDWDKALELFEENKKKQQ